MTIITSQAQIADASNADLLETYNALTGKATKKFASRAAAETQVSNAILAAEDAAGHAGVAKGEKPSIKLDADGQLATPQIGAEAMTEETQAPEATPKEAKVKKTPAPKTNSKTKATPAKKAAAKGKPAAAPAKKAKAEPKEGGRSPTYTHVRLTAPDTLRRPQADSMRTKVLNAVQTIDAKLKADKVPPAKRIISIEDLSKHVEFNTRSFIHKLAFQGWVEVAAAPNA